MVQLRPIISNIGPATYDLAKYLAPLLKPLSESQYAIKNSKIFAKRLKKLTISPEYKMVSIDVVSLFTNVPLDGRIDIIIIRIYDKKEINTDIPAKEMSYCTSALKMDTSPLTTKRTVKLMLKQWAHL